MIFHEGGLALPGSHVFSYTMGYEKSIVSASQLGDNVLHCLNVSQELTSYISQELFCLERKEILDFQEVLDFLHPSNLPPVTSGRAVSQHAYKLHSPGELLPKAHQVLRQFSPILPVKNYAAENVVDLKQENEPGFRLLRC